MKDFFREYVHIIAMVIIGLVFGLSFYNILINVYHGAYVKEKSYFLVNDNQYIEYNDNLKKIKNNLDNYSYNSDYTYDVTTMQKIFATVNSCYSVLNSNEGIMGKINGDKIGYYEVYSLNNYFANGLVDKCFITNVSWIDNDVISDSKLKNHVKQSKFTVDILSNNSLYIKNELRGNSNYHYNSDISNSMVRNNIDSSYKMVLNNYNNFSKIILELSNYWIRGE